MTSLETLRQMWSIRPGIKVILMSGHDKLQSAVSFEDMRPDGFIAKPFGYSDLESAIRFALAK
jgi:DNA-binding NtrC family response regulator